MGSGLSRPYNAGFRILNVLSTGAAANTLVFPDPSSARSPSRRNPRVSALVPWLDFIVSINGYNLNETENCESAFATEIMTTLKDNDHGNTVILEVFNIKRNAVRTVQITLPQPLKEGVLKEGDVSPSSPSSSSSTSSPSSSSNIPKVIATDTTTEVTTDYIPVSASSSPPPILGAVITWEPIPDLGDYGSGYEYIEIPLHVTEIEPDSPAEHAGLIVNEDYLLGCTIENITYGFEDNESFGNAVYDSRGQDLLLYVYCLTNDTVRIVNLPIPETGKGVGIGLSSGSFHQLPLFTRETDGVNIIDLDRTTPVSSPSKGGGGITVLPFESFIVSRPITSTQPPENTGSIAYKKEDTSSPRNSSDNITISRVVTNEISSTSNATTTPVPTLIIPPSISSLPISLQQQPPVQPNIIPPTNIIPTVVPPPVVKFMPSSSSVSTTTNNTILLSSSLPPPGSSSSSSPSITPFGSSDHLKKEGPGPLSLSLLSHLPPPRTLPVNESPVKDEVIDWPRY